MRGGRLLFFGCALLVACSAGVGPIGIDPIGGREDPGNGLDPPSAASAAPKSSGDAAHGDDDDGTGTLAGTCEGTFDCNATAPGEAPTTVTLERADGGCTFVSGQYTVTVGSDHSLTADGQPAGSWSGDESGFTVNFGGHATPCTVHGANPADAGAPDA
jgi:hypothetical protein